jgi:hypothetical protein
MMKIRYNVMRIRLGKQKHKKHKFFVVSWVVFEGRKLDDYLVFFFFAHILVII